MKWYSVKLLKPKKRKDKLGNAVPDGYEIVLQAAARVTPWQATEATAGGVSVTHNPARLAIPLIDRSILTGVTHALVDGCLCDVTDIRQGSARWTHITVEGWHDV